MREISALELSLLVKELRKYEGFHIDKFYELSKGSFRIRLSRGGTKADLLCVLKRMLCSMSSLEIPEEPSSFAMAVRKRIANFTIQSIEQLASDRIIVFKLVKGESSASIILEMMGKGNLIMTDNDGIITLAYMQADFKDRKIRNGEKYTPPRNDFVGYNSFDRLAERVKEAEKGTTLIAFLAKNVNVGSLYLEDALNRAETNPRVKIGAMAAKELGSCIYALKEEIKSAQDGNYFIYRKDGVISDYAVCEIMKYSDFESEKVASLQELYDIIYESEASAHPEESEREKELKASIERQRELIKETAEEIESNKEIAEKIFNNMNAINALIEEVRSNKRITKEELQAKTHKIKILDVDLKDKEITIEID
ncbi:MAG TPA: NFACT family protein [Candidatus Acidoferrum sp.]|nr:NFACT family protein [Candidatus Acidoferrum sp.]